MQVLATTHPPIEEVRGRTLCLSRSPSPSPSRSPSQSPSRSPSKPEPGSQPGSALPVDDDGWLEQIEKQFGGNK